MRREARRTNAILTWIAVIQVAMLAVIMATVFTVEYRYQSAASKINNLRTEMMKHANP